MDRSAQSDLQVALSASKALFTDDQDCTALTISDSRRPEPRVGGLRNRPGVRERLFRVDAGVELRRDQRGQALGVGRLLLPPHGSTFGTRPRPTR